MANLPLNPTHHFNIGQLVPKFNSANLFFMFLLDDNFKNLINKLYIFFYHILSAYEFSRRLSVKTS